MGKAGSSILNQHGLDLVLNKSSPQAASAQGTNCAQGSVGPATGGDPFSEIKNQTLYWTSSGGGTVEDKFSTLGLQETKKAS